MSGRNLLCASLSNNGYVASTESFELQGWVRSLWLPAYLNRYLVEGESYTLHYTYTCLERPDTEALPKTETRDAPLLVKQWSVKATDGSNTDIAVGETKEVLHRFTWRGLSEDRPAYWGVCGYTFRAASQNNTGEQYSRFRIEHLKLERGTEATAWTPAPEDVAGESGTVLAIGEIDLHTAVDVAAVYRYYLLQSSTLSPPAAPTANPPGGQWALSEPGYDGTSTNSLYTVDLTVFSDNTFSYSAVSLSSSYEAAKLAWNKADSAQGAAEAAQEAVDTLGNLVRVDTDGLHVMGCREDAEGVRQLTGGEVLVDSEGMSVKISGSQYSRFAARYAQFGDYQIRRAYDNGLLFRLWTPVNNSDSTEDEEASG